MHYDDIFNSVENGRYVCTDVQNIVKEIVGTYTRHRINSMFWRFGFRSFSVQSEMFKFLSEMRSREILCNSSKLKTDLSESACSSSVDIDTLEWCAYSIECTSDRSAAEIIMKFLAYTDGLDADSSGDKRKEHQEVRKKTVLSFDASLPLNLPPLLPASDILRLTRDGIEQFSTQSRFFCAMTYKCLTQFIIAIPPPYLHLYEVLFTIPPVVDAETESTSVELECAEHLSPGNCFLYFDVERENEWIPSEEGSCNRTRDSRAVFEMNAAREEKVGATANIARKTETAHLGPYCPAKCSIRGEQDPRRVAKVIARYLYIYLNKFFPELHLRTLSCYNELLASSGDDSELMHNSNEKVWEPIEDAIVMQSVPCSYVDDNSLCTPLLPSPKNYTGSEVFFPSPSEKMSLHLIFQLLGQEDDQSYFRNVFATNGDAGFIVTGFVDFLYDILEFYRRKSCYYLKEVDEVSHTRTKCFYEAFVELHSCLFFHAGSPEVRDINQNEDVPSNIFNSISSASEAIENTPAQCSTKMSPRKRFIEVPPSSNSSKSVNGSGIRKTIIDRTTGVPDHAHEKVCIKEAKVISLKCVVDTAVYSRNRVFRTLGSSKIGKDAVLALLDCIATSHAKGHTAHLQHLNSCGFFNPYFSMSTFGAYFNSEPFVYVDTLSGKTLGVGSSLANIKELGLFVRHVPLSTVCRFLNCMVLSNGIHATLCSFPKMQQSLLSDSQVVTSETIWANRKNEELGVGLLKDKLGIGLFESSNSSDSEFEDLIQSDNLDALSQPKKAYRCTKLENEIWKYITLSNSPIRQQVVRFIPNGITLADFRRLGVRLGNRFFTNRAQESNFKSARFISNSFDQGRGPTPIELLNCFVVELAYRMRKNEDTAAELKRENTSIENLQGSSQREDRKEVYLMQSKERSQTFRYIPRRALRPARDPGDIRISSYVFHWSDITDDRAAVALRTSTGLKRQRRTILASGAEAAPSKKKSAPIRSVITTAVIRIDGSRYCSVIGREHKSNNIYFVIHFPQAVPTLLSPQDPRVKNCESKSIYTVLKGNCTQLCFDPDCIAIREKYAKQSNCGDSVSSVVELPKEVSREMIKYCERASEDN